MDTIKKIGDLVKRRKGVLDDCVRQLRAADGASDATAKAAAVKESIALLAQVRGMSEQIDKLYATQIAELEKLRAEAAQQGSDAVAAAQGAIVRLTRDE
jgi:hypothetical protein